jgi:hypothetical protein
VKSKVRAIPAVQRFRRLTLHCLPIQMEAAWKRVTSLHVQTRQFKYAGDNPIPDWLMPSGSQEP